MPKVLTTLSNLFSRNRTSKLEIDAVPTPDNSNEIEEINGNTNGNRGPSRNIISPTTSQDLALIAQNELNNSERGNSVDLCNGNVISTNPTTNNVLAVNNTQGQVVYQFSHIKGLQLGSVYHINTGRESSSNGEQKRKKTKTVDAMIKSNQKLQHEMLDCISKHLGEGWQGVMRQLKYSDGQIHQYIVDNYIDGKLKETIYQLLLDWTRRDRNATVGKITQILWKSGHFETVDYMKDVWKEQNANVPSPQEENISQPQDDIDYQKSKLMTQ